jgi:hypothetical protein
VHVEAAWRGAAPRLAVQLPGFAREERTSPGSAETFNLSPAP